MLIVLSLPYYMLCTILLQSFIIVVKIYVHCISLLGILYTSIYEIKMTIIIVHVFESN